MRKILKSIFPIEGHELNKFLSFTFMLLFIILNFNIMRNLKDSLLVANLGAEVISFVKLWLVTPSSLLIFVLYSAMCNRFSSFAIFNIFTTVFLVFVFFFAFISYPNQAAFHPSDATVSHLIETLPRLKWFFVIYGKWTYAVFYVMAELWGALIMVLLFWQFANQVTTKDEAKRFYPMVGLFSNFGLISAGVLMKTLNKMTSGLEDKSEMLLKYSGGFFIFFTVLIIIIRYYSEHSLVAKLETGKGASSAAKKKKPKLTLGQSFKMIFQSKYLGLLALIVLGNGICVNLVEGIWKDRVRKLFPDTSLYSNFMSDFAVVNGLVILVVALLASQIMRKRSWRFNALVTPILMLTTGGLFLLFAVLDPNGATALFIKSLFSESLTPLYIAVLIGTLQNALIKASKYSLFDATKEMAYIATHDEEMKTKGKAAVDVVGGRLAKSGGALIQFSLFTLFPGSVFDDIVYYLIAFFVVICVAWIYSVLGLSKEYEINVIKYDNEKKKSKA